VTISTDGSPVPEDVQPDMVSYRVVTPGYVEAMQVPLLEGRTLVDSDRADTVPVGMVNSALATWLWPDGSAVGKQLAWSDGSPWFTVVGVIGNVHQNTLSTPAEPEVYVPYEQDAWLRTLYLMVRAESDWGSLAAVREAIRSVDRTVPISNAAPMSEVAGSSMATPRAYTILFSLLALLALGLGAVGVFGVLSYTMSQRTHEIGVRKALGATRRDVVRSAMRSGLTPVAVGLLLGLAAALAATRLVSGLLFGVAATDPGILVGVIVVLGTVATLAGLVPALRAARVDPARSLRQD
jgi:putative ABC transport system permease protein